ncbi:5'-3' exoribonuclease 4 [Orobanche gracilis]
MVLKYVEGLYYPYHYAPFASDLKGLADLEITFFHGEPFKPFDQLLGTLPAASSAALPERYRRLMIDPASPIFDFYPPDFEIDMNGKRFAWQGVAKLPFIDEKKLLAETKKLEDTLTEEEQFRNSLMFDLLYVHPDHALAAQISLYCRSCNAEKFTWTIDTTASGGMNGFMWLTKRNGLTKVIPSPVNGLEDIMNNQVLNIIYLNPAPHAHIPKPPEHAIIPDKILRPIDIKPFPLLWHEDNGGRNQLGKQRPQVSGAISGPLLGEAAHRLVCNTLNINSGRMHVRNIQGNHAVNRMRPAGPPGYERGVYSPNHYNSYGLRAAGQSYGRYGGDEQGYNDDPNFLYGSSYSPHFPMGIARGYGASLNGMQSNNQTFNAENRYSYQEQHHDLRNGMCDLTMEAGSRNRTHGAKSSRSSSQVSHMRRQPAPSIGPLPSPPPKWIDSHAAVSTSMHLRQQLTLVASGHDLPVNMVYQVKDKAAVGDSELEQ